MKWSVLVARRRINVVSWLKENKLHSYDVFVAWCIAHRVECPTKASMKGMFAPAKAKVAKVAKPAKEPTKEASKPAKAAKEPAKDLDKTSQTKPARETVKKPKDKPGFVVNLMDD